MLRKTLFTAFGAAALLGLASAANAADTTRIETRPFYGATVTYEAGVRVFRPLPADKRVIINPNGSTPLNLGFQETTKTSTSNNYYYDDRDRGYGDYGHRAGRFHRR